MTARDDVEAAFPLAAPGAGGWEIPLQALFEILADRIDAGGGGGGGGGAVTSVAGRTGAITLTTADVNGFTTAVNGLISAVVAGAPGALDTLDELAAALGDDANFASTITGLIGAKASTASVTALSSSLTTAIGLKLDASIYTDAIGTLKFRKAASPVADVNTITFVMLP